MRKIARTDRNQSEIVKALRQVGASVRSLAQIGDGVPDLLVGIRGVNYLLEVKDGSKPPSHRTLTDDEKEFFDTWKGQKAVVNDLVEALAEIGAKLS